MKISHRLLVGCLVSVFCCSSFAGFAENTEKSGTLFEYLSKKDKPENININLSLRSCVALPFNDGKADELTFNMDYVMLGIHGNVTDKLSYRFLQRFNKTSDYENLESLADAIDYAFLKYWITPKLSVTAGKQALFFGGFEYDYSRLEIYEYSGMGDDISSSVTGVNMHYHFRPNQEVAWQIANNRKSTMEETYGVLPDNIEKPFAPLQYSLMWNGRFADDFVSFRYAATASEQARGRWGVMLTGGQLFDWGKCNVYVDVLYNRAALDGMGTLRRMGVDEAGNSLNRAVQNVEYLTCISELDYRFHSKWNAFVKGYYDWASVYEDNGLFQSGTWLSAWGYQGGIEFYPMADDNLHIFANALGKTFREVDIPSVAVPSDRFRVSVGFIYRILVL